MSKISDFYAKAIADDAAKKELDSILDGKELNEASEEQLLKVGKLADRLGFSITLDEARSYLKGENVELDEDDLEAVAGGKGDTSHLSVYRGDELKLECYGSNGAAVGN